MSVLQPSDVAEALPNLTDAERQLLIDQAESAVAQRLGMVPQGELSGSFIEIEEGASEGPLNVRTVSFSFYPNLDAHILELPNGPMTRLRSVQLGDDPALDLTETPFIVSPWSLRWRDRSRYFYRDVLLALSYDIGWDPTDVSGDPETTPVVQSVFNAIKAQAVQISTQQAVAGGLSSGEVKSEKLGPLSTTYATSADQGSGSMAEKMIEGLLMRWRKPSGLP